MNETIFPIIVSAGKTVRKSEIRFRSLNFRLFCQSFIPPEQNESNEWNSLNFPYHALVEKEEKNVVLSRDYRLR